MTLMAARARSVLFVPGNRPDRFASALAAGAGLVLLDLEDAVLPSDKDAARATVGSWLAAGHICGVRINAAGTRWHAEDRALASHHNVVAVMLPKADDPAVLARLAAELPAGHAVIALIETARGVLRAAEIAASPGVSRLAFGSYDLAAELGIDPADPVALAAARSALVLGSAMAGLAPPIDGVTGAVSDADVLRADLEMAVRLGFGGKLCIHPRQVSVVEQALRPSEDQLRWARSVIEAAGEGEVTVLDGRLVDLPVLTRAQRILAAEAN